MSESHHPELNKTHNGYYAIENAGQLYWFAKKVDDGSDSLKAVLTDNIIDNEDVLGENGKPNAKTFREYNPIGDLSKKIYFKGTFDGNGKNVSGLYCANSITTYGNNGVGLISTMWAAAACVKNVTVKDSYFAGYQFIGGIVGWIGAGSMENCHSYATVAGKSCVGGAVGGLKNTSSFAEDCTNHGDVYALNSAGGFVGELAYYAKVKRCANFGDVTCMEGGRGYFGGFASSAAPTNEVVDCFNAGNITYNETNNYSNQIGGFVSSPAGTFTNCYTTGIITTANKAGNSNYKTGGFLVHTILPIVLLPTAIITKII